MTVATESINFSTSDVDFSSDIKFDTNASLGTSSFDFSNQVDSFKADDSLGLNYKATDFGAGDSTPIAFNSDAGNITFGGSDSTNVLANADTISSDVSKVLKGSPELTAALAKEGFNFQDTSSSDNKSGGSDWLNKLLAITPQLLPYLGKLIGGNKGAKLGYDAGNLMKLLSPLVTGKPVSQSPIYANSLLNGPSGSLSYPSSPTLGTSQGATILGVGPRGHGT